MIRVDPVFSCRIWTGTLDRDGYGLDGTRRAHVIAWERERGPIPAGLEIDHICRRRACCALHHLEAVTRSENERRKSFRYRARRTHCPAGHDLRIQRAITNEGGITCRLCNQQARNP